EILPAHQVHEVADLACERRTHPRHHRQQNLALTFEVGMTEPEVEAVPLQRLVYFPGPVAREHYQWRPLRSHSTELRDVHLERGQVFQQEGFKCAVHAVDLVDQEHGWTVA